MKIIELSTVANQSFSVRLDDERYDFLVKEARGTMVFSITREDVKLVDSIRAVNGTPLLPYKYLEKGNFFLYTEGEELPDYNLFGVTQFLVYVTIAEILAYG